MQPITIQGQCFEQAGKPIRILSGAMHYFRIMPERGAWRDRMIKLKAMGLNTIETYVAWNLHEPRPGRFVFSGRLDLVRYPYMCIWCIQRCVGWILVCHYIHIYAYIDCVGILM